MTYDEKYENMPLRGKTSITAWAHSNSQSVWSSRREKRKLHRHYDPYDYWWEVGLDVAWTYKGVCPSRGYRRKTWKDYRYGAFL